VKWISHQLRTFAIYYTIFGTSAQSLLASLSSILPDAIEMGLGSVMSQKQGGTPHNPLLWLFRPAVESSPATHRRTDGEKTNQEISSDV
jgi:hypothetical protein